MSARRNQPEAVIARAIVQHYRQRAAPGVFMLAVPNGGLRSKVEAAIMRGTGTTPGAPDTIWIKNGQAFALELKSEHGRLSENQRATHDAMRAAGAIVGVAVGLDPARQWLEGHGLLRGRAQCGAGGRWQRFRQELAAAPTREAATEVFYSHDALFLSMSSAERERRYAEIEDIIAEKPTEDSPCQGRSKRAGANRQPH